MTTHREIDNALRDVAEYHGASVTFDNGKKHRKVRFAYNGLSQFNVLSSTPSDVRAINNVIARAKRTIKDLIAAAPPVTVVRDAPPVVQLRKKIPHFAMAMTDTTLGRGPKIAPKPITFARAMQTPAMAAAIETADRERGKLITMFYKVSRRSRRRARCRRRMTPSNSARAI